MNSEFEETMKPLMDKMPDKYKLILTNMSMILIDQEEEAPNIDELLEEIKALMIYLGDFYTNYLMENSQDDLSTAIDGPVTH